MSNLSLEYDEIRSAILRHRRSDYDVTNSICISDTKSVSSEVCRLFQQQYPQASTANIAQAFIDFERIYTGQYPEYYAAETPYHDIQHCLDVTLCMMRLLMGYQAVEQKSSIDADLAELGIIVALFHDVGFIRHHDDVYSLNGAVYTATHVSRGADFLDKYLPQLGLEHQVKHAELLIHFTGYEMEVADIKVKSYQHKIVGYMIGSSDLLAQMADRCYLEKCSERLFTEFVFAEFIRPVGGGEEGVPYLYESKDDLMEKTADFMQVAIEVRLQETLGGVYDAIASFFGGADLYMDAILKNKVYLETQLDNGGWQNALHRKAPWTLV